MLSVLVVLYDNLEFSGGLHDLCTILVVFYDNLEFSGGLRDLCTVLSGVLIGRIYP